MNADRAAEALFDSSDILYVIDVAMGKEEQAEVDLLGEEPIARAIGCVEEHPTLTAFQCIAVRFENAASKTSVWNHG
jgi:hypothetical protein